MVLIALVIDNGQNYQSKKIGRCIMLKRIISGGQSGVEIAAFETAIELNIPMKDGPSKGKGKKTDFGQSNII